MSLEGLFQTASNRTFHHIHIVRTSCSQLSARSEIFCLLVEVIYWPYGLKFVYPMINLAFLGIIVKLKFLKNFACSFTWFCLQIRSDAKYFFLSCPRYCDWDLIVVIGYYFQIWNKKNTMLLFVELWTVRWVPWNICIWFLIQVKWALWIYTFIFPLLSILSVHFLHLVAISS